MSWRTIIAVPLFAGCAVFNQPDSADIAAYCTPANGYRIGSQSRAYFGVCPKDREAAFLAALERGRGLRASPPQALPYYERMERTEKELLAAASEPERERLRQSLRDIEWWAIHIVTSPGTYSGGGSGRD